MAAIFSLGHQCDPVNATAKSNERANANARPSPTARHDERSENTATKAKRAERHDDHELQQLTHRSNLSSLASSPQSAVPRQLKRSV
jgi:hypothetical protein